MSSLYGFRQLVSTCPVCLRDCTMIFQSKMDQQKRMVSEYKAMFTATHLRHLMLSSRFMSLVPKITKDGKRHPCNGSFLRCQLMTNHPQRYHILGGLSVFNGPYSLSVKLLRVCPTTLSMKTRISLSEEPPVHHMAFCLAFGLFRWLSMESEERQRCSGATTQKPKLVA